MSAGGKEISRSLNLSRRMKILHVGKFFYPYRGGMENFLLDLVVDQNSRGMSPAVIAHHHLPCRNTVSEFVHGIPVLRTWSLGQFVYVPISPTFGLHLQRTIADIKPAVIHLHLPNLSCFWALLLPPRIPLVIQWQSDVVRSQFDERLSLLYPFYQVAEKRLLQRSQAIIVSSDNYLNGSSTLLEFKHKCVTIPLGLDDGRIHRPGCERVNNVRRKFNRCLVVSAGRFTYYKGFDYLIQAAKYVPQADFVIVGDGPLRPKFIQMIRRLKLDNRVSLPGSLPDPDLHALMAACDIFCLPSIERTEAFGIVLLEAMSFSKPLVTTNIQGSAVNWVNLDGETGLVARPADVQDLATAISMLQRDPVAQARMGANARSRLEQHFKIQKVSDEIEMLYSTLAFGSRPSSRDASAL